MTGEGTTPKERPGERGKFGNTGLGVGDGAGVGIGGGGMAP